MYWVGWALIQALSAKGFYHSCSWNGTLKSPSNSVTQNLSDGLRAVVMSTVGCEYHYQFLLKFEIALNSRLVGAMIYVSPTLTMIMMAVVPPVSLGAVCFNPYILYLPQTNSLHLQFFYGRYLKKLSNQTQEAIGDMTKVCKSPYNICLFTWFSSGCFWSTYCSAYSSIL